MKTGWKIERLGDVLQKSETVNPTQKPNKEFLYVDVSSVNNQTYSIENATLLKGKDAPSRARKFIKAGDVIFATVRPTLKRVAIIPEEYDGQVCSTGYFVLRAKEGISNKYLFYFLLSDSFMEKMEKLQKGASYPAVTDNEVRAQQIPIPPLPEQQRIVALLDETFAALTKVHANAERNQVNAREVFELSLEDNLRKARNKWGVKNLGDVCEGVEYGTSAKSSKKGKVPVLRMGNIQNGRFNWDSLVYTSDKEEIKKYLLKYNDVLFNRTNSPELVGKTAIYKDEMPAIFAGYLIRIHRKEDLLDAEYLNYFLNSDMAKQYGKTVVISSVNQANINGKKLQSYPIPLPPLAEQRAIVQRLDALAQETRRLEEVYRSKVEAVEVLRRSVLGKAFSGEL